MDHRATQYESDQRIGLDSSATKNLSRNQTSVTGLPYIIVSPKKGIFKRMARWVAMRWYGWAVSGKRNATILQNQDDLKLLSSFAPKVKGNAIVTNGSGVDLERFAQQPKRNQYSDSPVNVLFVGRFLKEKGVFELMDSVRERVQRLTI